MDPVLMSTPVSSAQLFERAKRVMPSGYTRNMIVTSPHPNYADSAKGCWITDVLGTRRIDWVNNFASLIHGHDKPQVVDTIKSQAGRLLSATMPADWEVRLAELLVDRIHGLEQVRFTNSGTEANMVAIKAARALTGKSRVAKVEGGYHGQYDLLEASFLPSAPDWGPAERPAVIEHNKSTPKSLLEELVLVPLNDIKATRSILRECADDLAAFIIDPYGLALGVPVQAQPDYLLMLREETAKLGIALIFDEVWSLRLHYNGPHFPLKIEPDFITMGKMIGGGLPIGAIGGSRKAMSVFSVDHGEPMVKHSGTFTANPMSTAAGYAAMELMTPGEFDRIARQGEQLGHGLRRALRMNGVAGNVINCGSMTMVSFSERVATNYREYHVDQTVEVRERAAALGKLLENEALFVMRNLFVGSTAMSDTDIEMTIEGFANALKKMNA